ncbi:MAG: hypothetical protein PHT15_06515, partial [Gallionellaceae bacterium]|nr:hypothetical protein [Gallionellaceae bacterium]
VTGLLFKSVRYGLFYRVDVLPARATYGNEVLNATVNANGTNILFNNVTVLDRGSRSDCAAAPNCTYAEEMTNFANWYAYYHTRMQMMKTSAGKAFSTMDSAYRIGFVTINASTSWTNKYVPVAQFTAAQKTSFYSKFYAINPNSSTPLREALARAGRYFAGKHGLPGDSMNDDPVEYSCQQNYVLLTTDGYWNGTTSSVVNLGGTQMGNQDNADSGLTKRSFGVYDGGCAAGSYSTGGCADTLADVAQYYYATDLRTPALANCTSGSATGATLCSTPSPATDPDPYNNVPTPGTLYDPANWQHMVTFTLGLADGLMLYQPDYASSSSGDFSRIKTGATGCDFSGAGTCNWPTPKHDTQTALDDLWHAAVNGRGNYYNARDPDSLAKGLGGALSAMKVQTGAAAASATSSPNITRTDRSIFSSTYRTVNWDGEVQAQLLDPATGNVPSTALAALPVFSSLSLSGSTVSVTTTAHGLTTGDLIQVQNASGGTCDSGYNTGGQSVTVTVVDANHFTYTGTSGGATVNTQCNFYKAGVVWSAQTQLDIKVNAAIATGTDPEIRARYIVTYDQSQAMPLTLTGNPAPNGVKEFRYNKLTPTEAAWFDNKCAFVTMSQCTLVTLSQAEIDSGNLGSNLVPYLRGNTTLEQTTPNPTYRARQHFLGDTVNGKPAYVRAPFYSFTDPVWQPNHAYRANDTFLNAGISYLVNIPYTSAGVFGVSDTTNAEVAQSYTSFLLANQTREAALYIAANDGMLHSFDAGQCTGTPVVCTTGTGNETWAYV